VFSCLRENRIISSERYELEEKINEALNNNSFLGSVLSNSDKITVYDNRENNTILKNLKSLKLNSKVTFKDSIPLQPLPYTIGKSTTNSRYMVYVSSKSSGVRSILESIKNFLQENNVDILFGASCSQSLEQEVKMETDAVEIINGPTDFELVSMIQRAKGILVFSAEHDSESLFVKSRCMQLGAEYCVIKNSDKNQSEFKEFINKTQEVNHKKDSNE
jgi:hypothetical protein